MNAYSVEQHGTWPELEDLQSLVNWELGLKRTTAINIVDYILGGERAYIPTWGLRKCHVGGRCSLVSKGISMGTLCYLTKVNGDSSKATQIPHSITEHKYIFKKTLLNSLLDLLFRHKTIWTLLCPHPDFSQRSSGMLNFWGSFMNNKLQVKTVVFLEAANENPKKLATSNTISYKGFYKNTLLHFIITQIPESLRFKELVKQKKCFLQFFLT